MSYKSMNVHSKVQKWIDTHCNIENYTFFLNSFLGWCKICNYESTKVNEFLEKNESNQTYYLIYRKTSEYDYPLNLAPENPLQFLEEENNTKTSLDELLNKKFKYNPKLVEALQEINRECLAKWRDKQE